LLDQGLACGFRNPGSDGHALFTISCIVHLPMMIAEIRDAFLQLVAGHRREFPGGGLLKVPQNPLGRTMLMLEFVTFCVKPSFPLRAVPVNCRSRARQVLRRMIEVQDLLVDVGTKKIPVGFCAISDTNKACRRI